MIENALYWLFLNIVSIMVLAFYSMTEMACVSLNRVRLHYYLSKGMRQAKWLSYLLHHPARLFGTTLIGVNVAMVVGSECSREFHSAIGLSPDLAPLTQVGIVVIFGELAPMFAARHYAEHVAWLGAPILYTSARLMAPLLWLVNLTSRFCNRIIGGEKSEYQIYLSLEELQNILREQEDRPTLTGTSQDFNMISKNIFQLRDLKASQVMTPIESVPKLPSSASVAQTRPLLKKQHVTYVPIYHQSPSNILGIAFPRDLLRTQDTKRIRDSMRKPWFITQSTPITQIIRQFRTNNQSVAVVLDEQGKAVGLINLESVLEQIFGRDESSATVEKLLMVEQTFPGDMQVAEFNAQFHVILHKEGRLTLAELVNQELEHSPEVGESIYLPPFELTVVETSLLEAKTISIKTI